jgi:microcystin-dependent protein
MMWATATAPTGWLICNGQSTTGYTALAAVVGATVPDMRGDVPVGFSSGDSDFGTLLGTGGVKSVTLTGAQSGVAAHNHTASAGNDDTDHSHSGSTGTVSADHAHYIQFTETTDSTGDTAGRYDSSSAASQGTQTYYTSGILTNHTHSFGTGGRSAFHAHPITVNNATAANASAAHTNLQPYIVINYIIKH